MPRAAIERDYQVLEHELRPMAEFEVDQYDGLSRTDQPPLTMLVRVEDWVVM